MHVDQKMRIVTSADRAIAHENQATCSKIRIRKVAHCQRLAIENPRWLFAPARLARHADIANPLLTEGMADPAHA
jgi:hypothetical protein